MSEITYMQIFRKDLNISWKEHFTNKNLYGKLPLIFSKIKSRRIKMSGYCIVHPELSGHPLILWEHKHVNANRVRRRLNYEDMLIKYILYYYTIVYTLFS